MDSLKLASEGDSNDIILQDSLTQQTPRSKSRKTRMLSMLGINREEDSNKKEQTTTTNAQPVQNPVFGKSKSTIKRLSRNMSQSFHRDEIIRDQPQNDTISQEDSTEPHNSTPSIHITRISEPPAIDSSPQTPPKDENINININNTNVSSINENLPGMNHRHYFDMNKRCNSPNFVRQSIINNNNNNNMGGADNVNKQNKEMKWVSTKSSSTLPIQYSFLQSPSRILPIAVVGSRSVGKSRLIDTCFLYDTLSQCVPVPPPFHQSNFKKKRTLEMSMQAHSGIVNADSRSVNFTIARYHTLASSFPYKTINHFMVVYDVSRIETLEFAQHLMQEIQKNSENNNYAISLVANKIEKCTSNSTAISESLFIGFKVSCEYNAKFIAITDDPIQIEVVGDFLSNIVLNSTGFHNFIYHQNSNAYIEDNPSNAFILDDSKPIQKEEFLWVLKQNVSQKLSEESSEIWIKHYGVVKGEFFIYCEIESNLINALYLPVCECKNFNQSNGKFIWEMKSKQDQTSLTFATNSLKSFSEWIICCCQRDSDLDIIYDNIFQLFGEIQIQHPIPLLNEDRFSAILHNSLRIFCVDCGLKGYSNYISKEFGTFLCNRCSSVHQRLFGRDSRIVSLEEIIKKKNLWPLFHINCNHYFNVLYEGKILYGNHPPEKSPKITKNSTLEERITFIRDKYEKLKYYSCPNDQLFLISPFTNDHIDYTKLKDCKSDIRYLDITPKYFILLYSDQEKKNLLHEFHISCCFFRLGREIGLSSNYFQIFVPNQTFLFKATTTQIANRWNIIFRSSLLRSKLTEFKSLHSIHSKLNSNQISNTTHNNHHHHHQSSQHTINPQWNNGSPDPTAITHKVNKRVSQYKLNSLNSAPPIVEVEEVKMTKEKLDELLNEKNALRILRQNYHLQLQLKEYLEMKLSETLNTLKDLEIKEKKAVECISNIEPISIQQEVAVLTKMMDDSNLEYESIQDDLSDSSESKRVSSYLSNILSPRNNNNNSNSNSNNAINITVQSHGQHVESNNGKLVYESPTLAFSDNGYVKGGTLEDLVEILISQDYNEPNYCDHFLKIFPSFSSSFDFIKILCRKFSSPIIMQNKDQGNQKKRFVIRFKKDSGSAVNYRVTIKAARVRVLSVIETWLSEYWKTDFENDFQLITFLNSFFDYIVDCCDGYSDYAQTLRTKLHQSFNNSYISIDFSNLYFNPIDDVESTDNSSSSSSISNPNISNITAVNNVNQNNNINNNNSNNNKENNKEIKETNGQGTNSGEGTQALPTARNRMSKIISSNAPAVDAIIELDPGDIAKQLCCLDFELFGKIRSRELLNKNWTTNQKETSAPNIIALIERFNRTSQWVSSMIVMASKKRQRIKIIERFIAVAQKAKDLQNLHGVVAILGGLQDPSILRLKRTWEAINSKSLAVLQDLTKLIQVADNWANYRKALAASLKSQSPCVPYIGVYLKDLVFLDDGLPNYLSLPSFEDHMVINYEKRRKIALILAEIQCIQKNSYHLPLENSTRISIIASFFNTQLLDDEERYQTSKKIEELAKSRRKQ